MPYGVAFDAENVWVSTALGVFELRASDGNVLQYWNVPRTSLTGVAFDGADIWVAGYNSNKVGKL
jgi:hypothetical protein